MMPLIIAIKIVRQSTTLSLPITRQTDNIMATEATFTASRNTDKPFELRIFFTNGLRNATNTNEGKNIATVETIAPYNPLIWYPIKVTDEKTGPGVNCPTAIASISCFLVSNPVCTNSVSKKQKAHTRYHKVSHQF